MHTTESNIIAALQDLNQPLGTLSTVNKDGSPQSAGLYYVFDEKLSFYFLTRRDSRKYLNIMSNPHVALSATTENPPRTIQVEGIAQEVTDASEESAHFSKLVALASAHTTVPPVSQFGASGMVFVKIDPTWIRSGNFEVTKSGDVFADVIKSAPLSE